MLQCGFVRSNFAFAMTVLIPALFACCSFLAGAALCRQSAARFSGAYWALGAGEGNRTLVISLEGFCPTQ
jgi:hypothetical protein